MHVELHDIPTTSMIDCYISHILLSFTYFEITFYHISNTGFTLFICLLSVCYCINSTVQQQWVTGHW